MFENPLPDSPIIHLFRSWFIGNTVQSDGKIFLSTNIDPLFLALPYIYQVSLTHCAENMYVLKKPNNMSSFSGENGFDIRPVDP